MSELWNSLSLLAIVAALVGLSLAAPVKGSRFITRSFGPKASRIFRISMYGLLILLIGVTVLDVASSLRKGGSTAAMLTPFTMLLFGVPIFWGATLAWVLALIAWRRLRS